MAKLLVGMVEAHHPDDDDSNTVRVALRSKTDDYSAHMDRGAVLWQGDPLPDRRRHLWCPAVFVVDEVTFPRGTDEELSVSVPGDPTTRFLVLPDRVVDVDETAAKVASMMGVDVSEVGFVTVVAAVGAAFATGVMVSEKAAVAAAQIGEILDDFL